MNIVEIFSSIQGEGMHQGRPCIFVRCAGCNLSCSWCDTGYARDPKNGEEMTVDSVYSRIQSERLRHVCITGGEPLLQIQEVLRLCQKLHREGFFIEIETNGTVDFRSLLPYAAVNMDMKCPSSGEEGSSDPELIPFLRENDTLTFVVRDEQDCRYADAILAKMKPACEVFFSLLEGSCGQDIARYICDHACGVRMQIQLHKQIGVR